MPKTLVVLLALLLASCGGGAAQSLEVALYGDSIAAGGGLQVRPAQRIAQALPQAVVHDYSVGGTSTLSALQGDARQPFTTLPEHVAATHPAVVLLLYGFNDRQDPGFEAHLRALVLACQTVGARVVLATQLPTPAFEAELAPINEATRRVAADTASQLADSHLLAQGVLLDGIHPDQAYSDARSALLFQAIQRVLGS